MILLFSNLVFSSLAVAQTAQEIKGVVQEVDAAVGTVTMLVNTKGKSVRVKRFNLASPDLPFTDAAGKALKLTELQPDQRVLAQLNPAEDIVAIRMAPPAAFGTLTGVDVPNRVVTIKTKLGDKTAQIPEAAAILVDLTPQPLPLSELKLGLPARFTYSSDKKTVIELRVGKKVQPVARLVKGIGYLIDLDRGKRTLSILVNLYDGDSSLLRPLTLDTDATFSLMYQAKAFREITLSEVAKGVKLTYWTDLDTRKVVHLEVDMPVLGKRAVKAFDAATSELTLADDEGDKSMRLAQNAKVIGPDGSQPATIRPGVFVSCGLSPDRGTVEAVFFAKK